MSFLKQFKKLIRERVIEKKTSDALLLKYALLIGIPILLIDTWINNELMIIEKIFFSFHLLVITPIVIITIYLILSNIIKRTKGDEDK